MRKLSKKAKQEMKLLSEMNDLIQQREQFDINSVYVFDPSTGTGEITKIPERLKYNRKIIEKLSELVESDPELRFGQILEGFGLYKSVAKSEVDISDTILRTEFYTESKDLYKRIKDK